MVILAFSKGPLAMKISVDRNQPLLQYHLQITVDFEAILFIPEPKSLLAVFALYYTSVISHYRDINSSSMRAFHIAVSYKGLF